MRPRAILTLAVALILAGVSVALARAWLTQAARSPVQPVAQAPSAPETVRLVVAARPLGYGDRLRASDVKLVSWPKAAVPAGALHGLEWLTEETGGTEGPGRIVLRPMAANEPVLTSKVTGFGAPSRLAATIAPGMRATTIRTSGAPDMAALIGPGDRVDVLIARDVSAKGQDRELRSDVLLRDVRVLGLDEDSAGPASDRRRARAVTLEVTVEQAQILAVAEKVGTLSIVLRGIATRDEAAGGPVSSHDLPAGRGRETVQPAAWLKAQSAKAGLIAKHLKPPAASPAATVRVFRGLEASDYEVAPEQPGAAIRMIDAAKMEAPP